MMQKEEKVVVVLLVMAVITLIIAFFGFSSQPAAYSKDSKLDERVYVEGTILSNKMTGTGDNLIITLSNLDIKVFVPENNGAKEVYDSLKTGDRVKITGKVQEYKNAREIVVGGAGDVVKS
jgi:DNA/RNA endonuclease YhcR with UshA esterase domain